MAETGFTGKFLKPTEAFEIQRLDPLDLNRLGTEILWGIVVLAIAVLAVHFFRETLQSLKQKKGQR